MLTPHYLSEKRQMKKEGSPDPEKWNRSKKNGQWVQAFGLISVVVADLVGYTLAGIGLGYLLFKYAGVPKWFVGITSLLGFGGAIYQLNRFARRQMKRAKERDGV